MQIGYFGRMLSILLGTNYGKQIIYIKGLKKNGITVIDKLDTLSINTLAKNIAQKLCRAFPNQRFIAQKLFIAISRIPMYYAEMPEGLSEANYFYKKFFYIF